MAIDAGLLWKNADTSADIEACVLRWAEHEKKMDVVTTAFAHFMCDRQSWQGTASQLKDQLHGAFDSPEAVGRWLEERDNQQRLRLSGLEARKGKSKTRNRTRLIIIERTAGQLDGSDSVSVSRAVKRSSSSQRRKARKSRRKVRPNRPSVRNRKTRACKNRRKGRG
jgi:hypothetical protein